MPVPLPGGCTDGTVNPEPGRLMGGSIRAIHVLKMIDANPLRWNRSGPSPMTYTEASFDVDPTKRKAPTFDSCLPILIGEHA